ncbi:PPC domain-containing protein [Tundrisphaera lichenicola]|uniref:PPC domain-containing protein n=1 Tax=Tundrisphaera lichenicola TaxID=2029860 RepID=UPI003EBF8518
MIRPLATLSVAVGLVAAAALADSPKITAISPFGVRRGEPTEVTITGTALEGTPRLIAPFSAEVAAVGGDAANWKARITPAAGTPVGVYVVRVRTDDGLSNPFLFAVGQIPQVAEAEENGTFETAQAIPSPVVVEGQAAANDVDFFKFAGKKGQRVVIDAQCARIGSGVDPSIRLTTAGRVYVASADDTPGLATDARMSVELPEDGDYVIELSDSSYQGGGRPVYRLLVGPIPVVDEIFPLGGRLGETIGLELKGGTLPAPGVAATTLHPSEVADTGIFRPRLTNQALGVIGPGEPVLDIESMPPLAVGHHPEIREPVDAAAPPILVVPPVVFNGRIESKGDEDRYKVVVAPGQKLRIAVDAAELGSALDGVLKILGPDGAVLATADDTPTPTPARVKAAAADKKSTPVNSPDPSVNFTVPAGITEITLALVDLRGEGGPGYPYRLTVEPVEPSAFLLESLEDQVNIPKGGTVAVGVIVTRQGYDGLITVSLANPPPGLTVRPGRINPGQAVGALTISATPEASIELAQLKLIGEGQGPGGPILIGASKPIVFAQQANLPTKVVVQEGLPAATSLPTPITLDAPNTPIEVVHGYGVSIPVKAARSAGTEEAALKFATLPLPAGFALAESTLAAKADQAGVTINAAPEAPLGPSIIALNAKGPIAGKERTLDVPAVTLEVVRPAVVELAAPSADVKAGETIEVKGKVTRKDVFKEPVTVKLDGLPAGLKAEPVTVPPDQSEFTLKVVAEPTAAATTAEAKLAMAFQIAKKDYPSPTVPLAVKVLPAQ